MVSCSRFFWIKSSSDHRRVWTPNLLHMNLKLGSKLKYLDFQKLKKILKIFFSAVTRLILKLILAIFRIIFQKIDIISDVIIPTAAILKKIFYHFFCNITKYDCVKVHVKSIFLSGFTQGETLCDPPPPGHDQTKIPRGR